MNAAKEPIGSLPLPLEMKKILSHEFSAFAQPGALVATFLVVLVMALGDAAIAIAARGWPF